MSLSYKPKFQIETDPIGRKILVKAENLTGSVRVPEGVKIIGEEAFALTKATEIFIPDSVREIDERAFEQCTCLKRIRLPEGLWKLENSLFVNCLALESIEIPSSVTEIGRGAFYNCVALKEISGGEGLRIIGKECFIRCSALEELHLPDTVECVDLLSFSGCRSIKKIVAKAVDYSLAEELTFVSMGYETLVCVIGARLHCYEELLQDERAFTDSFFRKNKNVFADIAVLRGKADTAHLALEKGLITERDYREIKERIERNAGL